MIVYFGTATAPGAAGGVYVFRLDPSSGALTHVQTAGGLLSPTFLALHPLGHTLYAVERQWTPQERGMGALAAFAIEPRAGTLTLLDRLPSEGSSPCYVSVHPDGTQVFVAHFASGHVVARAVQPGGRPGAATSVIRHQGTVGGHARQEGPHAHCIVPDLSGTHALSCDLGLDRVLVYRLDAHGLAPHDPPFAPLTPESGPRHLAFHPGGAFVYVISQMASTLTAFAYDGPRGVLAHVQTLSTLPEDFGGESRCAHVALHPNGRFVYGSNRGHDSIAGFALDPQTGRVTARGHAPTGGHTPRHFAIDPTGTIMLVANQDSDSIVAFRIDPDSGRLHASGAVVETPAPVCVVFRAS